MPNPRQPHTARPPLHRTISGGSTEWQEAFYLTWFHQIETIHNPAYVPMSGTHSGPYSAYDAALQRGREDLSCTHFSIDKVWVHPGINIHFKDKPEVLTEEFDDSSMFADDVPGLSDTG